MNDYSKSCRLSFQGDDETATVGVLGVVGKGTVHQHDDAMFFSLPDGFWIRIVMV